VNRLKLGIVSCLYLGCAPKMPGTVGTLGGVAIAWALAGSKNYCLWIVLVCALLYLIGLSLADWAEEYSRGHDPQFFVLDEVIGYLIAVLWCGAGFQYGGPSYLTLFLGFLLFRLFDILKPGPVRKAESLPGGHGILMDDVVAGVFAWIVLTGLRLFVGDSAIWLHIPEVM
jgi:phosphatidylglycerophosphatase A